jgi:hypothetical protein
LDSDKISGNAISEVKILKSSLEGMTLMQERYMY